MIAGASGLFALGITHEAHALPLVSLYGNLRGLYGSASGTQVLNPYGFGAGLSAGLTIKSIYAGVSFDYFFGEKDKIGGFDTSVSMYQAELHGGYDFGLGPLTLRPNLGLGVAHDKASVDGPPGVSYAGNASTSKFVASPGLEGIISLGLMTVSAEVSYAKVFSSAELDGLIVGAGIGLSL